MMGVEGENVCDSSSESYESEKLLHSRGKKEHITSNTQTEDRPSNVQTCIGDEKLLPSADVEISKPQPEEVKATPKESEEDEVPDGGWGWIVAFGGFLAQMMVNIITPGFGLLYSEFLLNLGTSPVFSSWIYNLMGFMMTMSGIFINALVEEFGFRLTAFMGILMISGGVFITAFAESPWTLLICYSFLAGTGNGIIGCLSYSIVPLYFKKRLGVANAIMSSGVSAGQIFGPMLITRLLTAYAYKGAIIVLSGFILHGCLGAVVFHPKEWHLKVPRTQPKKLDSPGGFKLAWRILTNTLKNLKLMKSPVAVIVALGGMFNFIGYLNFLTIVPFAMQEAGFTVKDAATGLTISGMTNLATRLVVSAMADIPKFNMRFAYMFGTLLTVVLSVALGFLDNLTSIQVAMGFWGLGVGIYMGLFNLVMVKFVGREKLMAQIGMTCCLSSFWFLSCGPLVGAIREASSSYTASICTLAGTIFITFVLYLFLPAAIAYDERRAQREGHGKS